MQHIPLSPLPPKMNTFLFFILYPVQLIALSTLILYPIYFDFGFPEIGMMLLGWMLISGIGAEIGLHRLISHSSIELRRGLKPIVLWLATLCLQGGTIGWASIHRNHHKFSDTKKDAHSPMHGKWYAYHGWMYHFQTYYNLRYVVDLVKDPMHVFFTRNYIKIILISYLIIGLISWHVLLFVFIIPAAIGLHLSSMVNILCHVKNSGYQTFDVGDGSKNVPWLAMLTWGLAWHNNHHAKPAVFDQGTSISKKWWEFDPSLLLVPFLATQESRIKIFTGRLISM